jgi:hypothetical protein
LLDCPIRIYIRIRPLDHIGDALCLFDGRLRGGYGCLEEVGRHCNRVLLRCIPLVWQSHLGIVKIMVHRWQEGKHKEPADLSNPGAIVSVSVVA